jgi:hypothetical protein
MPKPLAIYLPGILANEATGQNGPVSQSSPECTLAKAPANVLGVWCVVVEAK